MTREHDAARQQEVYWEAFARSLSPTAADAERVRAGLLRRLAQVRPVAQEPAAAPPREAPRAAAAVVLFAKSAAISVGLAVTALGGLHLGARALSPTPAELPTRVATATEVPRGDAPVPSRRIVEPPAPATSPSLAPVTPTLAPQATPTTRTTARAPGSTSAPSRGGETIAAAMAPADALQQELALVRSAREAIAAGRHADADAPLARHAQQFPDGALAPEREAYRAIVACRLGRGDASKWARAFAQAHPTASLLGEVNAACE
jgi:hypothetical protein